MERSGSALHLTVIVLLSCPLKLGISLTGEVEDDIIYRLIEFDYFIIVDDLMMILVR